MYYYDLSELQFIMLSLVINIFNSHRKKKYCFTLTVFNQIRTNIVLYIFDGFT